MRSKHLIPVVDRFRANKLPTELEALGHFFMAQKSEIESSDLASVSRIRSIITLWDQAYIKSRDEKDVMRIFFIVKAVL